MTFISSTPSLGVFDVASVTTDAPGIGNLPGPVLQAQLGTIVDAVDPVLGGAQFILLAVPVSTTIAVGLIVTWNGSYVVVAAPTAGSATAQACAVALNAVTSNASSVQYTWFQIQGKCSLLKTAVAVVPGTQLYISGTAGRAYVTASTNKQITGVKTSNTATVASGTSLVPAYINFPLWGGN